MDISNENGLKPRKPWYKKWWVITLLAVVGLIMLNPSSDKKSVTINQQPTPTQTPNEAKTEPVSIENTSSNMLLAEPKALDYKIVHEISNKRYDGGKNYFVLIEKVDLSTKNFKVEIRQIVDEIVKSKGEKISIEFVNDRNVLDLIYESHYGKNTLGRILTKEELEKIGLAEVASFDGKLDTGLYQNTLSFFPGIFKDNPTVGEYVETVEYNPNK